jgi:hypothetical protein
MGSDLTAVWELPLNDKVHRIEFEHGTTTGRRVVRVDGEVPLTMFEDCFQKILKSHSPLGNRSQGVDVQTCGERDVRNCRANKVPDSDPSKWGIFVRIHAFGERKDVEQIQRNSRQSNQNMDCVWEASDRSG